MFQRLSLIFALSLVASLCYLSLIHDNIDSHLKGETRAEQLSPHTFIASDPRRLSFLGFFSDDSDDSDESKIPNYSDTSCINGKDPSDLTEKEQLIEFTKGPCAPVILVPGISASKLSVNIDCQTLQSSSPEVFKACGWSTCSKWKFWRSRPSTDYILWIADIMSPMSIAFKSGNQCLGSLMQLDYDPSQSSIEDRYISPKGVKVSVYGEQGTSFATQDCGLSAIRDILPIAVQVASGKDFGSMIDKLEGLGYQSGLTLFGAPYDWRKTTLANGVADRIKTTLKQAYDMTGKASVIVAHSLGNLGTLRALNTLSREEKDKYVANFVSIASALLGAPKAVRALLGGNPDYSYYGVGLDFDFEKKLMKGSASSFDIIPKDTYERFAEEPWMKDWAERHQMETLHKDSAQERKGYWENIEEEEQDYPYKWFPTPLKNCSKGFTDRPDYCGMFMYNWSHTQLLKIGDTTYTGETSEIKQVLNNYTDIIANWTDIWKDTYSNEVYLLKNPEVPVTLIYGSHIKSERNYTWKKDPERLYERSDFILPDATGYTNGDGTVPTASSLLPALKWGWEYENQQNSDLDTGAKPVKVVEWCSIHNNKGTIYDDRDLDSIFRVNKNEYIGLSCECLGSTDDDRDEGADCAHSAIINDSYLMDFVSSILHTNQKIQDESKIGAYSLSDKEIKKVKEVCPTMNNGTSLYQQLFDGKSSK